jgi:hypothetical protein
MKALDGMVRKNMLKSGSCIMICHSWFYNLERSCWAATIVLLPTSAESGLQSGNSETEPHFSNKIIACFNFFEMLMFLN